jgi:hypothetical protein
MAFQQYAVLDPTQSFIVGFKFLDSTSNPDPGTFRPVATLTQPVFNPVTQFVIQNGWTINPSSVTPNWLVQNLSNAAAQDINNSQIWASTLAQNIVTQGTNALANWSSLTPTQKDVVLQNCVKVIVGLLRYQFGVNT